MNNVNKTRLLLVLLVYKEKIETLMGIVNVYLVTMIRIVLKKIVRNVQFNVNNVFLAIFAQNVIYNKN